MSSTALPDGPFESTLHEVLQAIASALTPNEALEKITDGARRVFGVEFAIIWTLQGEDLEPAAWSGFSAEEAKTLKFKIGRGLAGEVALGNELVETDISTESKELYMPLARRHGLQLALHVPMRHQRMLKGVMAIADRGMKSIPLPQRRALKTLAAFGAIALGNAQLYQAALQAEGECKQIFESIGDPIYLIDAQARIVRVNPRVAALLKRPARELAGLMGWSVILGLSTPNAAPGVEAMTKNALIMREMEVRPLGGIFAVAAAPVRDAAGKPTGAVIALRDMTERRRLERQLAEAEKLTAIGQLVSGVAHELNNPLSSVIGFADLVARDPKDATVPDRLRIISDEARRAAKIVRNLLTFARQTKPERVACKLSEVVQRVLDLMGYDLRTSGVKVLTDFPPDLPDVMADGSQIQQLAINLMSNAAYAIRETKRPGTIWVQLKRVEKRVHFTVDDDGPGIAQPVLDHLFEPFVTTKPVGKGTGLGLSVCYGIVREHGGTIRAENRLGGGARFTIEFPVDAGSTTSVSVPEPGNDTPGMLRTARNLRILVIDDEPRILEFVRACFGSANSVTSLSDAAEAMRHLERGHFDIILSDLKMPGLDGRDLYNFIVRQRGELAERVVFMTGDILSDDTQEFLKTFELGHLEKPFGRRDLLRAVMHVLNQK